MVGTARSTSSFSLGHVGVLVEGFEGDSKHHPHTLPVLHITYIVYL